MRSKEESEKSQICCIYWSRPSESNRRPFDYESNALPTELGRLTRGFAYGFGKELNFRIYFSVFAPVKLELLLKNMEYDRSN